MLVLKQKQRVLLAETIRDIANIAAGAMVFGQFLADATFFPRIAIAGMAVWLVLVTCAVLLSGDGES